jgi:hypothetical protein
VLLCPWLSQDFKICREFIINLTICELIVWEKWEPQCLTTLWTSMACYRGSFTFHRHRRRRHNNNNNNNSSRSPLLKLSLEDSARLHLVFTYFEFTAVILLQFKVVSFAVKPQPGGPGPCIYVPQWQGSPVIPPGTRFPFCHLLQLTGLWWRCSNSPPHGILTVHTWTKIQKRNCGISRLTINLTLVHSR